MDGPAGVSLLDDGSEIGANFMPNLKEVVTQSGRVLGGEDLGICVVVEERTFGTPDDEHRLVRAEHH